MLILLVSPIILQLFNSLETNTIVKVPTTISRFLNALTALSDIT